MELYPPRRNGGSVHLVVHWSIPWPLQLYQLSMLQSIRTGQRISAAAEKRQQWMCRFLCCLGNAAGQAAAVPVTRSVLSANRHHSDTLFEGWPVGG